MEKIIGRDFTLTVDNDDRGRIVAEVWHNESGQTLGIAEVKTFSALHCGPKRSSKHGEKNMNANLPTGCNDADLPDNSIMDAAFDAFLDTPEYEAVANEPDEQIAYGAFLKWYESVKQSRLSQGETP